jgi:hypothetical protein
MSVDPIAVFSAFTTQIGGRQLTFDFTDAQKRIFASPIAQKVILFGMFYFSTRNLTIAFGLWVFYHLAIQVLLNEQHPLNVLPRSWVTPSEGFEDRVEKTSADRYTENLTALSAAGIPSRARA